MDLVIPETIKIYSQFFHPVFMWLLFAMTLYAFYLGMKARKTRLADKELRKELIPKNFSNRHHQLGSAILALMVLGALGGMAVTYINNGKLFVGPHLLAGLGMTATIALSASLVPFMQKGNDLARYTHLTLNLLIMGLFSWQALTGVQIVQRLISKL